MIASDYFAFEDFPELLEQFLKRYPSVLLTLHLDQCLHLGGHADASADHDLLDPVDTRLSDLRHVPLCALCFETTSELDHARVVVQLLNAHLLDQSATRAPADDPHAVSELMRRIQTNLIELEVLTAPLEAEEVYFDLHQLLVRVHQDLSTSLKFLRSLLRSEHSRALITRASAADHRSPAREYPSSLVQPWSTPEERQEDEAELLMSFGQTFVSDRWIYQMLNLYVDAFKVAESFDGHVILRLPSIVFRTLTERYQLHQCSTAPVGDSDDVLEMAVVLYDPQGEFNTLERALETARALASTG